MSIDLRNHFFNIFDLTSSFMTQGQKEVGIYLSPLNHDKWLSLHTNLNFLLLLFLVKKIKSLSSKQSKLNIWNRLHAKIAFLCRLWTQIGMWRPNYTICTSNVIAILKAGQNFFYLRWVDEWEGWELIMWFQFQWETSQKIVFNVH